MNHYITTVEGFGRCVIAAQDISKDKLLFTAELLTLSPEDTVKINETDLQYYTFKYNDKQDCIVLGDGELFNHSDSPNVGYKLIDWGNAGRLVMAFYTLVDVEKGEQFFIDYCADTKVDLFNYKVNLFQAQD